MSQKHVDFVLCNGQFAPYLVVELDGSSHHRRRQRERDATKDEVLQAAGLEVLRLRVGERWDLARMAARIEATGGMVGVGSEKTRRG